jgi:hypothetical protein
MKHNNPSNTETSSTGQGVPASIIEFPSRIEENISPAFQIYPGDLLRDPDIQALSLEALGAHLLLALFAWRYDPPSLPDDPEHLGTLVRNPVGWESKIFPALRRIWRPVGRRLCWDYLTEQAVKQRRSREARSAAGKKGNDVKGMRRLSQCERNAFADRAQCDPKAVANDRFSSSSSISSSSSFSEKEERGEFPSDKSSGSPTHVGKSKKGKPGIRGKTTVPSDFKPTDEMIAWAKKIGVDDPGEETEKFIYYHQARGTLFKDVTAAWRNWMLKSLEYRKVKQEDDCMRGVAW